jgi:hypothetical protein
MSVYQLICLRMMKREQNNYKEREKARTCINLKYYHSNYLGGGGELTKIRNRESV